MKSILHSPRHIVIHLVCLGVLAGAGAAPAQPTTNAPAHSPAPVTTNAPAAPATADLMQALLNRIELLEKKETERSNQRQAQEQVHTERERTLLTRIAELESKVQSLESGRVLPEITVSPNEGPTTQELDQKIRIAERRSELAAEEAEARARQQPTLSVGPRGVALSSADTNFVLRLRGLVQLDSRLFFDDDDLSEGNDSFLLRRARPIMEGTVYRDFDYVFIPEFGGSSVTIQDANLNYRYAPWLQLRAGKLKGPVGLEQLQSDATLPFNERSLATALVPNRSVGVQFWGELFDGALGYAAGVFNGAGDGRNPGNSDFNDDKEFAGRVFAYPFKHSEWTALQGFGVGVGGSYSQVNSNANGLPASIGGSLPGYATDGQQQFFTYRPEGNLGTVVADGSHWRLSPQATYLHGPFGLLGEYVVSQQGVLRNVSGATAATADLTHTAWQVSAQWVITGEPASFTGLTPRRPFDPSSGGLGAWQLVARIGQLDIDDDAFPNFSDPRYSASKATAWSVGVNWWLNKNVRLMTSFSHTTFDGGGEFHPLESLSSAAPATVTRQDESVWFTRLQLGF